jgi:hypothetical protein
LILVDFVVEVDHNSWSRKKGLVPSGCVITTFLGAINLYKK